MGSWDNGDPVSPLIDVVIVWWIGWSGLYIVSQLPLDIE